MIFIGIDCGTQSLKAIAWDPEGGKIVSASRSYGLIEGLPPGHKEQYPGVWIAALDECLEELRHKGVDMGAVAGIGVSGQQHGLVALDSNHTPVRASKLWCDTSTEPQCRRIMEVAGGREAYQAEIGNALPPGFTASKILWLKENEPENYHKARYFLLPHDYLNLYLTGEIVAEPGDASGTGYFRVRQREWSKAALGWIDPDRDLSISIPRLIPSKSPVGNLRAELQRKWGISSKALVSSGGGDNMMGAIGSGNVSPGTVTVSLGTSGTLYGFSSSPIIDPEGEIAAFCDSTGGWLPLVCTMNVTVATEMVRSGFFNTGLQEFNEAVASIQPGAEGLILVPYLEGERMPNVPDGTGVLLGLRPATATPAHLARAAMEGVTFGLFYGMERMQELGIAPSEIRLIGGGAKSRVWRQIVADVFDRPVECPAIEEGPAFGAALQALWCVSGQDTRTLIENHLKLDESTRHCPDDQNRSVYQELYAVYKELGSNLVSSGIFEKHRRFITSAR
ncbi:MAG TPA: xylulokinase [Acidobacteriota bacterium]|nr:xylulokinase [Acidobacteriota bacterium]